MQPFGNQAMQPISNDEYCARRAIFLEQMGENAIAIIPSAEEKVRSHDTMYPYCQDRNFFYLTGFNEPESILILRTGSHNEQSLLFCRSKNVFAELWHGHRLGPEHAIGTLCVDHALSRDTFEEKLPDLLSGYRFLFYSMGQQVTLDQHILNALATLKRLQNKGLHVPAQIIDVNPLLYQMRMTKTEKEREQIQAANDITVQAHRCAMSVCRPGMREYEIEAEIQYIFMKQGARFPAYNSIVASGRHACCLHYSENNRIVQEGDLVLIDAGCELNGYASDITRTFPAGGTFTKEQKALYEAVLKAQKAAIAVLAPGVAWNVPQNIVQRILTEELIILGLLKGQRDDLLEKKAIDAFFPHGYGHLMGLDVHDPGCIKSGDEWVAFQSGMVLTVEPGLYIQPENDHVAAKWRGIGIRIEDNVVITPTGCHVLSADLPKDVDAIEALCAVTC